MKLFASRGGPLLCLAVGLAVFGLSHDLLGNGTGSKTGKPGINLFDVVDNMVDNEDLNLLERLLQKGADPNQVNKKGLTPLHRVLDLDWVLDPAIFERPATFGIVMMLLDYGANPNQPDNAGKTALHYAARGDVRESGPLMTILLKAGGDPNIDTYKRTPFEEALFCGSDAVAVIERATTHRPPDYARKKAEGRFDRVYLDGLNRATNEQERNEALRAAVGELVKGGLMSPKDGYALYQNLMLLQKQKGHHLETLSGS